MSNQKKITRREAIKVLGAAAGASLLANIPAKWSKPELTGGALPAHAQTSIVYTLLCDDPVQLELEPDSDSYLSGVTVNPVPNPSINMRWTLTLINVTLDNGADPTTGLVPTDGSGYASILTPPVTVVNAAQTSGVTVTWSFENLPNNSDTCDQTFRHRVVV